ncbi:3-hydroxyacyl-CoA dehydrogenase type-2 [Peziza echinospora]|nr:3-hydroxyacyl-CoA dehydrogenase type-2 [Peziza echinospora]
MKIEGRTFIISGGASGLGRATAIHLASQGGYISILDFSPESGAAILADLPKDKARFFPCDVTKPAEIASAVAGTISWIRTTTHAELAGVVCSAGIGYPEKMISISKSGEETTLLDLEMARKVVDVNLFGTISLIREVLPHLTRVPPLEPDGERGVVITVSSSAAFDGQPGQTAYSASKGAIRSITLPLARELARFGIRVVSVAPSMFETNMTKGMGKKVRESLERTMEFPKRAGRAEEFAHLVGAVVGNCMLNGEVVRLDGAVRMPSRM